MTVEQTLRARVRATGIRISSRVEPSDSRRDWEERTCTDCLRRMESHQVLTVTEDGYVSLFGSGYGTENGVSVWHLYACPQGIVLPPHDQGGHPAAVRWTTSGPKAIGCHPSTDEGPCHPCGGNAGSALVPLCTEHPQPMGWWLRDMESSTASVNSEPWWRRVKAIEAATTSSATSP